MQVVAGEDVAPSRRPPLIVLEWARSPTNGEFFPEKEEDPCWLLDGYVEERMINIHSASALSPV